MIAPQGLKEIWLVFSEMGTLDTIWGTEAEAEHRVRTMKFSYSYQKYVAEGKLHR